MTQNEQFEIQTQQPSQSQTPENKKEQINLASEKIKDAISLLLIMETDLSVHHQSDDTYLRTVQIIQKILKSANSTLES